MATLPPVRYELPIDMHVSMTNIVDVEAETTYRKCTTTIWVQEDTDNLVSHHYEAWFIWFDGDFIGLIRGPDGPSRPTIDGTVVDP